VNVVVVDKNDGSLGKAFITELKNKLPTVNVTPLALSKEAAETMDIDLEKQSPSETLVGAEVIIGPWTMALRRETDEAVFNSAIDDIASSKAHKLLIPISETGWDWIGVEPNKMETIVNEVLNAVKQIAVGEEVKQVRKLGPVVIALIFLVSLCILSPIVLTVLDYFMY